MQFLRSNFLVDFTFFFFNQNLEIVVLCYVGEIDLQILVFN